MTAHRNAIERGRDERDLTALAMLDDGMMQDAVCAHFGLTRGWLTKLTAAVRGAA